MRYLKVFFIVFILISIPGFMIWHKLNQPLQKVAILKIKKGSSLTKIANLLVKKSILKKPKLFIITARAGGFAGSIQAGYYKIAKQDSILSLLNKFENGDVIYKQVTIIEGITFKSLIEQLNNLSLIEHDLDPLKLKNFRQELNIDTNSLEGLFFPDTYTYRAGDSETLLLKRSYLKMQNKLDNFWQKRSKKLSYKSPYQLLIVASIIEKEACLDDERKLISGVIYNRLKQKMKLQMDPTVSYGLYGDYQHKLTTSDLNTDNPFNTYLHYGLPPSPISLPSLSSIQAAANPTYSNYLYFVANGDGSHTFSKTLKEQNLAVLEYRRYKQHNENKNLCIKNES